MAVLLEAKNIHLEYPNIKILEGIHLEIRRGEKIGLIGKNGSGKTSLAKILSGKMLPTEGTIRYHNKDLVVDYLIQETELDRTLIKDYQRDPWSFKDPISTDPHKSIKDYSGGEKRKIQLQSILQKPSDLLILDEPTNHLDIRGIRWLTNELKQSGKTLLIISHDRYFLDQITTEIFEVENGKGTLYKGNYSKYKEVKERETKAQLEAYENQMKEQKQIRDQIRKLNQWSDKGHRESTKNLDVKLGGKEYNRSKVKKRDKQIKSKIKLLERKQENLPDRPPGEEIINFWFTSPEKTGRSMITMNDIAKSFGKKELFEKGSFYIKRGEKIGVFGPNGCGKTTLVRIILGQETLDTGEVFISPNLKVAFMAQEELYESEERKPMDLFPIGSREERKKIGLLLDHLGLSYEEIQKPTRFLSQGEKTRLKIGTMIRQDPDLIILDEPTNHLDIHSRISLEKALKAYQGTILLITHDQKMQNEICTKSLIFENRRLFRYEGTLEEYFSREAETTKDNKEKRELQMVLKNRLSTIISQLGDHSPKDPEYQELDREYKQVLKKLKEVDK